MTAPDSIIGKKIVISVHVSVIDSGLAHILVDRGQTILDRVKHIRLDSLVNKEYPTKVLRGEVNETIRRFLNGFINAQSVINDTLIVCGVRGPDRVEG